ncbi:alpha-ribazole phosphatase [Sphingomonas sp.]|uniref:alpha-ribazole phosphatase n=1 Tax=Sphingomonas sp. TaxID=28214 RepID=UPI002ED97D9D
MRLILLRHTRPAVAAGVCYGASDLDCADTFAQEAAALLPDLPAFDRLITSPLRRCRRLADVIVAATDKPVTIDARLAEMDFGAWEGLRWDDIPRPEIDAWAADFHDARPHGGESIATFAARVAGALADARAAPGSTLMVTHQGVVRAARAAAERDDAWRFTLAYGGWIAI